MISKGLMLEDIDVDFLVELDRVAKEYGFEAHAIGEIDGMIVLALKPYENEPMDLGISVSDGVGTRDRTGP
jgi:hypothetical protein